MMHSCGMIMHSCGNVSMLVSVPIILVQKGLPKLWKITATRAPPHYSSASGMAKCCLCFVGLLILGVELCGTLSAPGAFPQLFSSVVATHRELGQKIVSFSCEL
jgi:hypothetical protein